MNKEHGMADGAKLERKLRWDKPAMNRIEAAAAEIGTRKVAGDGPFTSS